MPNEPAYNSTTLYIIIPSMVSMAVSIVSIVSKRHESRKDHIFCGTPSQK